MLRKIKEIKPPCRHYDHKPPMFIHLEPGVYEHVCDGCGEKTEITISDNRYLCNGSPYTQSFFKRYTN